jgi:hypothetical protein
MNQPPQELQLETRSVPRRLRSLRRATPPGFEHDRYPCVQPDAGVAALQWSRANYCDLPCRYTP